MMADEERRLLEAARRGEVESFNALVRLYEGRIYNLCYRMLGDADSAADAAQDAFLSAFRNLRSFRGGSFRSWMLRIATNTCYDALRARKRRNAISLDMESDEQRIILILSDIEGLAYEEIAQITNTNIGTVKSRLSRGRSRLRAVLKAGELLPARYRHGT